MKKQRCAELHIPHYNPQITGVLSLIELSSTVPLSAVNGLSHLTKLTSSKEQARPIRFENSRIGQSLSNRIESDGRFEFESNLEASQVPKVDLSPIRRVCAFDICSTKINSSYAMVYTKTISKISLMLVRSAPIF